MDTKIRYRFHLNTSENLEVVKYCSTLSVSLTTLELIRVNTEQVLGSLKNRAQK